MDVLSEVLKIVKLRGALFFNAEFSAPWGVASSQSSQVAPLLCPGAAHVILYHYLTEGRAYAQLSDEARRDLGPGDVVIFPHGDPIYWETAHASRLTRSGRLLRT